MTKKATEELAKPEPTALARPDFVPQDHRGTEHITRDDIKLPRLALAQGLSKQVEEGHELHIEGLKVGQLFNDLTQEILTTPLEFVVIRGDKPKYIEFIPRNEGGGVKDMNVPADDPRTKFTVGPDGNSIKPVASKIYDFVLALLPSFELVTFSLSSSGLKAAATLNALMTMRNAPIFAGKYTMETSKKPHKSGGVFYVHVIKNSAVNSEFSAGEKMTGWLNKESYDRAEALFEQIRDKKLDIKREPGDEDFDGDTLDAETVEVK